MLHFLFLKGNIMSPHQPAATSSGLELQSWVTRPGMCGQAQVKAEVRASAIMGPGGNGLRHGLLGDFAMVCYGRNRQK